MTQQVCGLTTKEYARAIFISKMSCIKMLPALLLQLGQQLSFKFVSGLDQHLRTVVMDIRADPQARSNLDSVVPLYTLASHLLQHSGLMARESASAVLFSTESELFSACSLLSTMVRCLILQRDQTVIDLQVHTKNPLDRFKTGKVVQKSSSEAEGQVLTQTVMSYTSEHIEETFLPVVLEALIALSNSPALKFLHSNSRLRLHHTVFFSILGVSSLKLA